MLNKWFKQKSAPIIDGNLDQGPVEKLNYIKVFELELSNMEDSPVYELKHQLSFGSEIGNIIIADPSVSPRHASFILQQEVVAVIDHGSVAGTFINGKKIAPGKNFLLEETDVVNVGDLEIKIKTSVISEPLGPIPEIPSPEIETGGELETKIEPEEEIIEEHSIEEVLELSTPVQRVKTKTKFDPHKHLKAKTKKKKKVIAQKSDSANALVRVFAVVSDLLLSYAILVVFLPFDEFRSFLEFVPSFIISLLDFDAASFWEAVMSDYPMVNEVLKDMHKFITSKFELASLFIMFAVNRLLTTLMFGVTLSEFILGVRPSGHGIWKRVGGGLRVLVGLVTGPFLVFDSPSIVSRRTLKEVITFTNIQLASKFFSILGVIFYLPFLLVLVLVTPLFQGLELPESVIVNDHLDQRVKLKLPDAPASEIVDGVVVREVSPLKTVHGQKLKLQLTYKPDELSIIPNLKFSGVKNKLNLKNGLIFYQRDLKKTVEVEVFKNFDLKQLLGIGFKGNFFLFDKYPELYNFVYAPDVTHPSFKVSTNEKNQRAFANEFIQFTKMAFSLTAENVLDIMQEQTLLLKGLVDYKSSFLSLIEYKNFDQVGFIKLGNVVFLRMSFNQLKPFDLIIPLIKGEGRILKVSWEDKESMNESATKFYKYNLNQTNWLPEALPPESEVLTSLEVFDLFSSDDFKTRLYSSSYAQGIYAYYFETSANMLKRGDQLELDIWKSRAQNVFKLLETIPEEKPVVEKAPVESIRLKLLQNFRDLLDALENNNLEYFGISQTTTI